MKSDIELARMYLIDCTHIVLYHLHFALLYSSPRSHVSRLSLDLHLLRLLVRNGVALLTDRTCDGHAVIDRLHGRNRLVAKWDLLGGDDPVEPRRHQQTNDGDGHDGVHHAEAVDHNGVEHVLGCEVGVCEGEDDGEDRTGDVL